MRICLIRPPIVVPKRNATTMFTPPIGLAYIAASLRQGGHQVSVLDAVGESLDTRDPAPNDCFFYGLPPEHVAARIPAEVDLIGIQFGFSFEWPTCRDLSRLIRDRFPDTPIIAGGEHLSAMPSQSLRMSSVDIAVIGEGEETIRELVTAIESGKAQLSDISGIAYKEASGEVIFNTRRPRVRAIDDIPWPAWDLLPIENYLDRELGFGVNRGRSMPILASRGCPYQCTFCSSPSMWTTRWLARDPDRVLDEIVYYQRTYGATNFDFYDLTAIVKKSWIVDFCEKVQERGLNMTWQLPSGTRSEAIDQEVADLLYRSGCRNLTYAPESGSIHTLSKIKKRVDLDMMIRSMEYSARAGINVKANFMVGFPGESWADVKETFAYISRLAWARVHDISIWSFVPYPGCELFEVVPLANRTFPDDDFYDHLRSYADTSRTTSFCNDFSDQALKRLRLAGIGLFYLLSWLLHPWRPVRVIKNLVSGNQDSRLEMVLSNMFRRSRLERVAGD